MSDLSLNFLIDNFYDKKINFFDIGCNDLTDTIKFKNILPNAKIYAFDCNNVLEENNKIKSKENNINYFHYAIRDNDDNVLFYPSDKFQNKSEWNKSGSTCKSIPTEIYTLTYSDPYFVKSITLKTFCDTNKVTPDFIHIDIEGAEYWALKNLGDYRPSCVWSEINAFNTLYESGNTFEDFDNLMKNMDYYKLFISNLDALYVHKNFELKHNRYKNLI